MSDEAAKANEADVAAETENAKKASEEATGIDAIKIDEDELLAEVERLRAENERLAATRTSDRHLGRNIGTVLLLVLGVLLFGMAITAVWLNRTVMNEDKWVATVAPLAQNADIQNYVAAKASDAIITNVDIQGYVNQALAKLPAQAAILSTPITGAIDNFIRESATKIVQSQQFYDLWVQMNRVGHQAFITAINDKSTGVIQKQGGTVTLDTTALIDQIKQFLSDKGLGFVNNINIPVKNETITLFNSPELAALGNAIQWMNSMAYILPLGALAFIAGAIALAVDRRKAVLWTGVGIVAATLLPLEAIYFGASPFATAAYNLGKMPEPAAQAAYNIVFRSLIAAEQLAVAFGLVIVVGALLAGPSRFATSLRRGFQHGLRNIGPDWDFGPIGEWIYLHASGMRTTGIVVAVGLLLVAPAKSYATLGWFVIAVIVWLALVSLFGRPRPNKLAETDVPSDSAQAAG